MPSSTSRQILYVGCFYFPDGNVAAFRVLGTGKALRTAGFEVLFVGAERRGREEDRQADGRFRYQGFHYVPEKDQGTTRLSRWKRACLTHFTGATTMRRLSAMDLSGTKAIIAYNASSLLLARLMSFCRRQRLTLVADCTEWYSAGHTPGGPFGLLRWDSETRMRWVQPRIRRVIAISTFLARYYHQRGCAVLRVPPLVDMDEATLPAAASLARDDGPLRLVYAGSPGKKDLLGNAIDGLQRLSQEGRSVELHLVGPGPQEVAAGLGARAGLLAELGQAVICHGRVAPSVARSLVAKADFSILLRPDQRFAHAGFPTKLVESLSLGVPTLTNLTSDIGEFVRDGREGVILADSSPEAFAAGVAKVLQMPPARWQIMRDHARQRARECFDYRQYSEPLARFLEQECRRAGAA